ncbi:MAG: hypothetical protein JWM24_1777 [Solirubrobacterales bacterium]|nr:hypothetical protein [Solirubrobacterales bacterium]
MRSIVGVLAVAVVLVLLGPASAFAAGSISGTVTAAGGGAPIAEVEVCAEGTGVTGGFKCTETAGDGHYTIASLPAGSYKVEFWPQNGTNYISQYYDGKPTRSQATPVTVSDGVDTPGIDAALVEGGRIAGRITDATTKSGIVGIIACASLVDEEFGRCVEAGSGGEYTIAGLTAGSYEVFFFDVGEEEGAGEYLSQLYRNGQMELVPVTLGSTTSGIDAALTKAGQITGTVTDALSGAGIGFSTVCARQAVTGETYECARTNGSGQYAIKGLPSGSYKVWFSPDVPEVVDDYIQQYYNGAGTFAQAMPITVVAPAVVTGINARLISRKAPAATPAAPQPIVRARDPRKAHCRRGLKKVRVKGKARCVKIHRKHRHRSHRHGPHGVATGR